MSAAVRILIVVGLSLVTPLEGGRSYAQETARAFTGTKELVSSEGNAQACQRAQPLTLYVEKGTVTDRMGCVGPVQPNGAFEGQCNNNLRQLHYQGQITGSTMTLNLVFRYPATTCGYKVLLRETR